MIKKYLDYMLWCFGWSVLYILTEVAWKLAAEHFGWDFSETAFLFGFLLAVIGMTKFKE